MLPLIIGSLCVSSVYASDADVAAKINNITVPSNWGSLIYNSDNFLNSSGLSSGKVSSTKFQGGEIALCVSGQHVNDHTPACAVVDPSSNDYTTNPGDSYGIGIDGGNVRLGISAAYFWYKNISSKNVNPVYETHIQYVEIASGDSSCTAFSNNSKPTNWWESPSISAWTENTLEYFTADISMVKNPDGKYYAQLTNCALKPAP